VGRRRRARGPGETAAPLLPPPAGARASRFETDGEMLVFSYPLVELRAPSKLSRAEAAVAIAVVSGLAVAEVARERQTAVRTVANQLRSVYAKLGVRSRLELARILCGSEHGP